MDWFRERAWRGVGHTLLLPLVWIPVALVAARNIPQWVPLQRPLDALGVVLIVLGPLFLLVRHALPREVLVGCAVVLLAYLGLGYAFGPVVVPSLIALAAAIQAGHRRFAYGVTVATVGLGLLLQATTRGGVVSWEGTALLLAWLAAYVAGCELWRARTERLAQARAAREETARRQAGEERLRIARELHDLLGHHVSLINVQAGVALYLMDSDPEQARGALATIKQSSGELLREMRATLGVLRGVDEEPPRAPTAGLAVLGGLVADNEAAGLSVESVVDDVDLPAGVDLAAYRIVQESLTNVRRHAGATRATVRITAEPGALRILVEDDGRGAAGGPPGNGLAGMRERAAALGGTLVHGPAPGGGFRVEARLPLEDA
ncbi:sensor histidine kinase [Pseudonocardia oroxyli]|uniref:histidine kinase n=1 Tax=Pseudonocardia oroxyli TaxID=366584 RepID=A0A1G7DUW8_PSEOR|nr:sensor histidine kinase [Pseudonocardia oroxyli]SDE55251.1 Signal transduction histidine kinase [Pseudonocardia oroxyli]